MWGESIIGFCAYHYVYESGREGEMILAGFAPRKQNLTLYNMGFLEHYSELLEKLGKHTGSKGCLHIKRLSDVNLSTLREALEESFRQMQSKVK